MAIDLSLADKFLMDLLKPLTGLHNIQVLEMSDRVFNTVVSGSALYLNFVSVTNADQQTFNGLQARDVRFEVLVRLQNLRSHLTFYPILASIEAALAGTEPIANCQPLEIGDRKFLSDLVADGLWVYSIGLSFQIYD